MQNLLPTTLNGKSIIDCTGHYISYAICLLLRRQITRYYMKQLWVLKNLKVLLLHVSSVVWLELSRHQGPHLPYICGILNAGGSCDLFHVNLLNIHLNLLNLIRKCCWKADLALSAVENNGCWDVCTKILVKLWIWTCHFWVINLILTTYRIRL